MKRRTGLVFALGILLLFLVLAAFEKGTHQLDFQFFQLESSLYYFFVFFVGVGAFLVFLPLSFSPIHGKKSHSLANEMPMAPSSDRSVWTQVEIAMQLGNHQKAQELLKTIGSADSEFWFALKLLGDTKLEQGEFLEAEQIYQRAIKVAPAQQKVLVFFALAGLYAHQDSVDQAQDLYRHILTIDPRNVEAVYRLRSLAVKEQNWEEAFTWQEYLEQHFPDDLEGLEEQSIRTGIRFETAKAEYDRENYRTALALLKDLLRFDSGFVPAQLLLGSAYLKMESPSNALKTWERALEITSHPSPAIRIAEYYLSRDLPEKAIETMQKFLYINSDVPALEYWLADLYLKLEMVEEAGKIFVKLDQLYPEWQVNKKALADLLYKTGQYQKAAAGFSQLLASSEEATVLPWKCNACMNTYKMYLNFCPGCLQWNTIQMNQDQAGKLSVIHERSAVSSPYRRL